MTFEEVRKRPDKVLITTSHRPTPNTRRLAKALSRIIPNAIKVSRGKLTFERLVLQSIDLDVDKILVIRNWKGNPRYIDVYLVNYASRSLVKLCTVHVCGYEINLSGLRRLGIKRNYGVCITASDAVKVEGIVENLLQCLIQGFNLVLSVKGSPFRAGPDMLRGEIHTLSKGAAKLVIMAPSNSSPILVLKLCPPRLTKPS